jgi:hypothetical protein
MSAARAFLHPAMKRPNLDVRTGVHVTSIDFDGRRATGISYRKGGRNGARHTLKASREVILCGGSYNSPQLLQISGIGPPEVLGSLGIQVRHALAGVGENLKDHYAPRFAARVKNIETINERTRGLKLATEVAKWAFQRKGILALSPTLVYAFWHSGETAESSDVQLTFTPASYMEGVQGQLEREPGMTVASWQQRPESRGTVRARSADPFDVPIINPNYLAEEIDRRVLLGAMKLARRLLQSRPLAPYFEREDFPGPSVQSDDELLGAAKERGTTTFHPAGTCRMGPANDPLAVVDDQLRVRGLEGLRVVDASIMPTMLSANLNAATMMLADKASDLIRGKTAPEAIVVAYHLDGSRADACGERAIENAFAQAPRDASQQILPEELADQIVGKRDAAGRNDVRQHHARETCRASESRTAAIEAGKIAQQAQVFDQYITDRHECCRADRRDDRHALGGLGNEPARLAVENEHEIAIGKAHEVARIAHIARVLIQTREVPAQLGAARKQALDGLNGLALLGHIALAQCLLRGGLDLAEATQAHEADELAQDQHEKGDENDDRETERDPADPILARNGDGDEAREPDAEGNAGKRAHGREKPRAPAHAAADVTEGRHLQAGRQCGLGRRALACGLCLWRCRLDDLGLGRRESARAAGIGRRVHASVPMPKFA